MDDNALAADLLRQVGSPSAPMLDVGLNAYFRISMSDVVSSADHAIAEAAAA